MRQNTIGIDLGGTNIRVALVEDHGMILKELNEKTEVEKGPEFVINKMVRMINEINQGENVKSVGIGAPGPLDLKKGLILDPPHLPGWTEIPLVRILEKETGLNVFLDNDANAAALAESLLGAGRDYESVYYITISTGVGAGFVINGKIFQGAQGYAGEIGNMIVNNAGQSYLGLNRGALEGITSGSSITREGMVRLGVKGGTEEVFLLAKNGDIVANEIIDEVIKHMAIAIANIIHTINPAVFILGGGVMKSEQQILEPLREKVKEFVYPGLKEIIRIHPAQLGTRAGIVGASLIPRQYE
ncbi:ROK family protein [Litchfieldia alkalitelluris]|uniref:ROK family protein n=1 Tax=Litchfieldia alkalitelluris TaxID=304268 RepID=UPI000997A654|nr:ROK family protein [Litchfieldia alkalitelluris]